MRTGRILRRLLILGGLAGAVSAAITAARRREAARAQLTPPAEPLALAPAAAPPSPPAPSSPPAPEPPEIKPRRSREQLYREAQAIGLKGRSKMTKAELERALEEHARGG